MHNNLIQSSKIPISSVPQLLRNRMSASSSQYGVTAEEGKEEGRTIMINARQREKFHTNYISTAKYSFWSFLPKFLYEQFRRYSNIFFLSIVLLQQIPDVSPTGRFTTLIPLCFILSVSAIKEIIEDVKRHKADAEVNNRKVEVLKNRRWQLAKWLGVCVGDFVKIKDDQFFPADIVIFATSEAQAVCYIETSNLDGETNLKVKQGLPETAMIKEKDFGSLKGYIKCELPNRHLYEFAGKLKLNQGRDLALNHDQILLRGAKLKNTNWIIGQIVYTGHDTKLLQNSTKAPLKRSSVDKKTNKQIIMLFTLLVLISLVSTLFAMLYVDTSDLWYLPERHPGSGALVECVQWLYSFLTFLILYNNLIPISLSVTLEVVRFLQALFINWDLDMYHEESDTPAMARTSNLNEELGQIRYVFSDKTGTLTRNIMEFKACTVGGKVYLPESISKGNNQLVKNIQSNDPTANDIRDFLELLAVCHTVIPDFSTGKLIYHAASPDERALVLAAKYLGYVFESRTPKSVEVTILGKKETYEILNVLEFTSTRKRMSVIVRTPEGKIKLMCKGADSIIYDLLEGGNKLSDPMRISTLEHLDEFANQGLRTLCCAVADISDKEYMSWEATFHKASTAITDREKKLEDASALIEKNLRLVGATAIEDKLQDKVPETIAALLEAGIHVWVLTGDKQETAINIGHSCRLLKESMDLLIINCENAQQTKQSLIAHTHGLTVNNQGQLPKLNDAAVIIDGKSLKYALMDDLRLQFLALCCSCKAVIVCRASPLQKAEIVEYVTRYTGAITLAIGDGANDVAMIQKAHVGVGISGQEGLQASCASDYAIAQFHFLRKLLFVHGAWNYDRLCKTILYSYYKNICLYLIELWFAIYSGWSGQIIFEKWTIGFYNMLFTCLQPICMGVFDRNGSEQLRLGYPIIYHQNTNAFTMKTFFLWIANSILHSVLLFWLSYVLFGDGFLWANGKEGGYLILGNLIYTYVVIVVSIKSGLVTKSWTVFTHVSIWGSIIFWMLFLLAYSYIYISLPLGADIMGIAEMVFTNPVFWTGLIMVPTATLIPDLIFIVIQNTFYISLEERFRQCDIRRKDPKELIKDEKPIAVDSYVSSDNLSSSSPPFGSPAGSGSSPEPWTSSTESTYTSSPQEDSKPKSKKKQNDSKSKTAELGPSGDKTTVPPVRTSLKSKDKPGKKNSAIALAEVTDSTIEDDDKVKMGLQSGKLNRTFIYDSKHASKKRKVQKGTKILAGEFLPGRSTPHPSTHPSMYQTRTKLEAEISSATMAGSLNTEKHQELRLILQQWIKQSHKPKSNPTPISVSNEDMGERGLFIMQ